MDNLADGASSAPVTPEELKAAVKKMAARNTAPGPDGIPGMAMSLALSVLDGYLIEVFNGCLSERVVSECWKTSKLVLIPKPGKDPSTMTAYRPICLINEAGKLFERVVMGRIAEHLKTIGPNIHEHQYGFRSAKSTIDAISRVRSLAEGVVAQGGIALAVSVDIVNAFNAIPWRAIRDGLARLGLPRDINSVINSYLEVREVHRIRGDGRKSTQDSRQGCPARVGPRASVMERGLRHRTKRSVARRGVYNMLCR